MEAAALLPGPLASPSHTPMHHADAAIAGQLQGGRKSRRGNRKMQLQLHCIACTALKSGSLPYLACIAPLWTLDRCMVITLSIYYKSPLLLPVLALAQRERERERERCGLRSVVLLFHGSHGAALKLASSKQAAGRPQQHETKVSLVVYNHTDTGS